MNKIMKALLMGLSMMVLMVVGGSQVFAESKVYTLAEGWVGYPSIGLNGVAYTRDEIDSSKSLIYLNLNNGITQVIADKALKPSTGYFIPSFVNTSGDGIIWENSDYQLCKALPDVNGGFSLSGANNCFYQGDKSLSSPVTFGYLNSLAESFMVTRDSSGVKLSFSGVLSGAAPYLVNQPQTPNNLTGVYSVSAKNKVVTNLLGDKFILSTINAGEIKNYVLDFSYKKGSVYLFDYDGKSLVYSDNESIWFGDIDLDENTGKASLTPVKLNNITASIGGYSKIKVSDGLCAYIANDKSLYVWDLANKKLIKKIANVFSFDLNHGELVYGQTSRKRLEYIDLINPISRRLALRVSELERNQIK